MKASLLAAAASFAFVAAGVANAQENPRRDEQRPPAARAEPRPPETPRAPGEMRREAPRAAESGSGGMEKRGAEARPGPGERREDAQARPAPGERRENAETKPAPGERRENAEARPGPGERREDAQARPAPNGAPRTAERNDAVRVNGNLHVSHDHAARIGERLMREARPVHERIAVRVGERVPETIVLQPLPAEVVEIAPEYRGYDYFVENDEIVFVSPESHEIVGSLAYEGRAASDEGRVRPARPCPPED